MRARFSTRLFSTFCRRSQVINRTVAEEAQDVASMDALLRAVRESSNPAYHTIIPMRSPVLWSQALLDRMQPPEKEPQTRTSDKASTSQVLTPRGMEESYSELTLPFGESPSLLENYTNASGGIRMGKLMEHLDSLAGSIAYKYMLGPFEEKLGDIQERGFYIVTASVDRLDMLSPLDPSKNLRLSGQVIYTGKSSMEVAVKMESIDLATKIEKTVLLGRFSMVCRDAVTHKARTINPIVIDTPEEQRLYKMGEAIKTRRQASALRSLSRVPPTEEEAQELHDCHLKYGGQPVPADVTRIWMGDTKLSNCRVMFPQERNVHQKVFGGFLMRLAYELGFTSSCLFSRGRVMRFLSLDGISFARPVPIGSILKLDSKVLYSKVIPDTGALAMHIGVTANVVDPTTGKLETTNEFRFTWSTEEPTAVQAPRMVVPRTYKDAMLWLEGKRALEAGDEIRERIKVAEGTP